MRRGSTVYDKSSIMLPRRLIYFKPNEARGGGGISSSTRRLEFMQLRVRVKSDLPAGK